MDALWFTMEFSSMGWKWTLEDPTPIHICNDILYDSKYLPDFYKICHGVTLLIYQIIFDKMTPRMSEDAETDLLRVGNWFGEDSFTCIRIYASLSSSHELPLFIPGKILAKEIAYQTVGNGSSKILKESNKNMWAIFPAQFGIYELENYNHIVIEINTIQDLNFPTIPNIQYDPHQTIKKITTHPVSKNFPMNFTILMIYLMEILLIKWLCTRKRNNSF